MNRTLTLFLTAYLKILSVSLKCLLTGIQSKQEYHHFSHARESAGPRRGRIKSTKGSGR